MLAREQRRVHLGPAFLLQMFNRRSLVNSGTAQSGYGYWYPGPENDGATGGGLVPEAWGRGWIGKQMPRGAWYYSAEADVGYVGKKRGRGLILAFNLYVMQ